MKSRRAAAINAQTRSKVRGRSARKKGLQFGERQFDRVEVGTVRWEESKERPDLLDGLTHLGLFVRR